MSAFPDELFDEPDHDPYDDGAEQLHSEQLHSDRLLQELEAFLARFIAYPSDAARVAHVLWVAHTHRMDEWESTPRIAFLSPEPGSGKSRALEVTELLVPRPVHAVNTTPAYLFRKVADEAGPPTLLYDEIDTVFGARAKDNEDVRGLLNAGHRKGAVAGRCVVKGKLIETEELPAYCAVALAGLDDLPDTLMSRSVIVRMQRRRADEVIEPFRHRLHAPAGHKLRDALAGWSESLAVVNWPDMPAGIEDRDADCWEALLSVADAAGGEWPDRARCAGVTLVTAAKAGVPSIGVRLLEDLRTLFANRGADALFTDSVLSGLVDMDEAPWGDIRGKVLDARSLARRLAKYGIHPRTIRDGNVTAKGYARADLVDVWARYCPNVTAAPIQNFKGKKGTEQKTSGVVDTPELLPPESNVTTVTTSQVPQ